MRTERGASQLLFGALPAQTLDLEGKIWKVERWVEPLKLEIDQTTLRNALLTSTYAWEVTQQDGGLGKALQAHQTIEAWTVNPERGVLVASFPKTLRCGNCARIHRSRPAICQCGGTHFAQLQLVAYHECGSLEEILIPFCPAHHQISMSFPGTTNISEIHLTCPLCNKMVPGPFAPPCPNCKPERMKINVHRSASVFSPHVAVIVNPVDPNAIIRLQAQGGADRAVEWMVDGMPEMTLELEPYSPAWWVTSMKRQKPDLNNDTIKEMLAHFNLDQVALDKALQGQENIPLGHVDERAQEEALSIYSAREAGNLTINDLLAEARTPQLKTVYTNYATSRCLAKLSNVELLTKFPVATLTYGFTRGVSDPGASSLVPFMNRGQFCVYGTQSKTEALLFQLDPVAVYQYLATRGTVLTQATPLDARGARIALLDRIVLPNSYDDPQESAGTDLLTLIHSYAHRMVKTLAITAGIERDGLAEYLLPHHLSFIIYATSHGDFILGGLQAVFETSLDQVLKAFVEGETRCPLDPGCREAGGACMACLHLGEPSCRWFNRYLDRNILFGTQGFML